MGKVRANRNKNYTTMANYHLRDKTLSLRGKGLMSYMLQLPDFWEYSISGLSVAIGCGKDQIRSGISELEKLGYLFRDERHRDEKGRLTSTTEYELYECVSDNPHYGVDAPMLDTPMLGNPTQANPIQITINGNKDLTKQNINRMNTKIQYADNVTMTEQEFLKLKKEYGETKTLGCIELISNYKASSGKTYKNDYSAIRLWGAKAYDERHDGQTRPSQLDAVAQALAMLEGTKNG